MLHSAGIRTGKLRNMEYTIICILRSLKYTFWMANYTYVTKKLRTLKVYSVRMYNRKEQTNKWTNEWMNEWTCEWMNEWMSEWMNKWSLIVLQIIFKWEDEWLQFCREFLQKQRCSTGVYGILQQVTGGKCIMHSL